jgi:hypothetical protein
MNIELGNWNWFEIFKSMAGPTIAYMSALQSELMK